jgi:hypothetical protein
MERRYSAFAKLVLFYWLSISFGAEPELAGEHPYVIIAKLSYNPAATPLQI